MPELNVLVVDDSKTARFAMRRYLERLEYLVQTAASAMEAYDYLKDHRPDVIFMDNVMPEISGLEALNKLKHDEKTAVIPVIFCTSIETSEFIEQARASGALQVLHKPPNMEQIAKLLEGIRALPPVSAVLNGEHEQAVPLATQAEPAPADSADKKPGGETAHPGDPQLENPLGRYGELRREIDHGMRKITDEICVQLSELKTQLHNFDPAGLTPTEQQVVHHIAHEESETLQQALRGEVEQLRERLEQLEQLQRQQQEQQQQLLQAVRDTLAIEMAAFRESMLQEASAKISDRLSQSLLRALGRQE